jgi:carbonic anhydrase
MRRLTTRLITLIDRRWHSSLLNVRSFRGADCDTDHHLVFAEVRKRLAVSKQAAQNLKDNEDINKAWKNIKENTKTSAKDSLDLYEWKQHKAWFDEGCSCFLDHREQAKKQW